jgi:signal peptidase I
MATLPARIEALRLLRLLAILCAIVWLIRAFVFETVAIADDAMRPQLRRGDVVLVAKWRSGRARHMSGGGPATLPARGDIVAVRAADRVVVRRVIGLPGERIAWAGGMVRVDGRPFPRLRIGDLVLPADDAGCRDGRVTVADGCRHRRYNETLPGGRAYPVLSGGDDASTRRVPPGHLFLLGDDRGAAGHGPRILPAGQLRGPATILIWSQADGATWRRPRAWWRAIDWSRIGLDIS